MKQFYQIKINLIRFDSLLNQISIFYKESHLFSFIKLTKIILINKKIKPFVNKSFIFDKVLQQINIKQYYSYFQSMPKERPQTMSSKRSKRLRRRC